MLREHTEWKGEHLLSVEEHFEVAWGNIQRDAAKRIQRMWRYALLLWLCTVCTSCGTQLCFYMVHCGPQVAQGMAGGG